LNSKNKEKNRTVTVQQCDRVARKRPAKYDFAYKQANGNAHAALLGSYNKKAIHV
jgi:hypothetical protein